MERITKYFADFFGKFPDAWLWITTHPAESLTAIMIIMLLEVLLSVDNAAVLATMVRDLPKEQQGRALKYGIIGAYFFRGVCLIFAALILNIWWLKPFGGLYLVYLTYDYFKSKATPEEDDDTLNKTENWLYKSTIGLLGQFWATVALVELMDLAFSIDNVFAAVSINPNVILVVAGVFVGILAMRFVAQWFVKLLDKYPFLESIAFVVIGILGIKLALSLYTHYFHDSWLANMTDSEVNKENAEHFDIYVSIFTFALFCLPILTSMLFNFPKKQVTDN
jgi:YkoY family integral membrane protein